MIVKTITIYWMYIVLRYEHILELSLNMDYTHRLLFIIRVFMITPKECVELLKLLQKTINGAFIYFWITPRIRRYYLNIVTSRGEYTIL